MSTIVSTPMRPGTLGTSAVRPDATAKVTGGFAFSSDMWADGMLWGATLRSPHPRARIRSIDVSAALLIDGVSCVITADDVPGQLTYGLIVQDQPVFARVGDDVRYVGEPVAAVAADHPETCRRALAAIVVDYEVLTPVTDPEVCIAGTAEVIHPDGNIFREQKVVHGDQSVRGDVVVEGTYVIGM